MNSARIVNNYNDLRWNCKSDMNTEADPAAEACMATTQNRYNARQLNNGQVMRDSSSLRSLFSGSKRKGIAVVVVVFVFVAGVVAIGASFVMLGMLRVQAMQIRSLQSELEALKVDISVCKNETTSLNLQLTTCEMELQRTQHQLEVNSGQCELEKANITAKFKAEIRESEHEKAITQEKLGACERGKEDLTQRLETQTQNAESSRKTLADKQEQCAREQRELLQGRDREIQRQVEDRVAQRQSWVVNSESNRCGSQSGSNGVDHLKSLPTVFLLSSVLLSFLFKVLIVV